MRRGFTLIEIMLAVSILAMIMGIAWGSYSTVTRQQQRIQDINARLHGVEQAINKMVRDLSTAFITVHGKDDSQIKVRYKTGFLGKNGRLDFTSMGYVRMFRDEKVGDQSEISYYIRSMRNDDGIYTDSLVRREQAPINDDFEKGGTIMVLLEDVRDFKLSYWDDKKADLTVGSDGWVDTWDTENTEYANRLPSRVRIEVAIDDPLGLEDRTVFTTQAEIHLTEALNF